MADTFLFELVTPERIAVSAQVEMVEVPGVEGDFGVLPGHAPFMSIIRPGAVTVHEAGEKKRYFVPSGYAEVNPEGCTVLAEQMTDLAGVNMLEVQRDLEVAKFDVNEAKDDVSRARAEQKLALAEALHQALIAA